MEHLEDIAERVRQTFDVVTETRDKALAQSRMLTRHCARAIRAIHRDEHPQANEQLQQAHQLAVSLRNDLAEYPQLYYAGYTQDALKEYAEARLFLALAKGEDLPGPDDLNIPESTYMKGLSEAASELRRRCLDMLRHGHSDQAEILLNDMDEIYAVLITMDYPDAVTGGLRRMTDILRSVTERTRGDLTTSLRQEQLQESLLRLEKRLGDS